MGGGPDNLLEERARKIEALRRAFIEDEESEDAEKLDMEEIKGEALRKTGLDLPSPAPGAGGVNG